MPVFAFRWQVLGIDAAIFGVGVSASIGSLAFAVYLLIAAGSRIVAAWPPRGVVDGHVCRGCGGGSSGPREPRGVLLRFARGSPAASAALHGLRICCGW